MKQTESIKESFEFKRVYKRGKSIADYNMVIYFFKNYKGYNRLGITVSNKLGKAVIRNKIKRRIKNSFHTYASEVKTSYDIVIVARTNSVNASFLQIDKSVVKNLKKLGLLGEKNEKNN